MCLMIDYRKYGLPRKRKVTFPIQTLYKYIQNPISFAPLTRWRREPRNGVLLAWLRVFSCCYGNMNDI